MAKRGPKPTVTPRIKAELIEMIRLGLSQAEALLCAGISFAAFRRAKAEDEKFGSGIKSAATQGKLHHLRRVSAAAERWQASAWFLERKYGTEYGKKLQLQGDPDAPLPFTLEQMAEALQRAKRNGEAQPQANGSPRGSGPLPG